MGKTVIVVGASGGIGSEVTKLLLKKGFSVIGTYYKDPDKLKPLEGETNFKSTYCDLQDIKSIQNIEKQVNQIFAVVNCAGIINFEGKSLDEDLETWKRTLAINLTGNYLLAKLFHKKLEQNGRFIMISSTDSYYGGALTASYAASKSGVNSLTKSISLLFADKKIRTNSIAPGWVLTPMTKSNGIEFLNKVASINPLKRNADPEDVAKLVSFLLSNDADYINGQVISLEGGYTNQDPTLLIEEKL